MTSTLIYVYAGAAILTAIAAYVASRRISVIAPSRTVRVLTSLVAGALWPIVLVGLAQVGVVVLYVKYAKPREQPVDQYSETVESRL